MSMLQRLSVASSGADGIPLLASQHDIWTDPRSGRSVWVQAVGLRGDVAEDILVEALGAACAEAEALRLSIDEGVAGACQYVAHAGVAEIMQVDLSAEPDPAAAADAWLLAQGHALAKADSTRVYLWALMRLTPDQLVWGQVYRQVALDLPGQQILLRRVASLYSALRTQQAVPPAMPWPGLAELAAAEAAYRNSRQAAVDQRWCLAECRHLPPAPSPSWRSGAAAELASRRVTQDVDAVTAAALSALALQMRATRPQLFCAAWMALLSRLTYQDDLLLGLAVRGRVRPHGAVARLVNLVPLRLTAAADLGFATWAGRVGQQMRMALRHRRAAHGAVLRELDLGPDALDPLGIIFTYLPHAGEPCFAGAQARIRILDAGPIQDLALSVEETAGGGLALHLDANRVRYEAEDAARMLVRLRLLLDGLLAAGAQAGAVRLADLVIMDEAERDIVARVFSSGPPEPPRTTLVDLVAAATRHQPDAIALAVWTKGGVQTASYAELDERSNRLARQLLARGVAPGDAVAIMLPRSVHLIVAILACTKARATFVPLDPGQPGTRLAYLLGASQARLLVTDAAGAALGTAEPPTLRLDEAVVQAEISGHAAGALDDAERGGAVRPEDPAYIVFTSGSTGRPKGVMVSHGAIAQEVQSFAAQVGGAPGEACVLVTSIAFDPAIQDIFVAFMQGMTVALMDEEARKDPPRVCSAILSYGAGYLSATPSALRALPLETLPDRFRIISGGEPFPAELLPRCRHLHLVANVYGPTEATVTTTWHSIRAEDTHGGPIPIGRPLAGYRVWILDRGLRPVPVGALGELCIGGGALADGYVGDPARTASAFHPNPFSAGRLYRTGDQARWRADGTIELLGRIDQQVKILGHRVEPAEVEHALRCLGWVADAAVLPYGDRPTLKLAAYVVPQAGCEVPSTATVRAALSTSLPRWMLPGAVLQMAALPYTTTGKIDLKALPYVAAAPASPGAGQMPRSEDERLLCDLFARLTGHKDVGVETDFFDIGGDSLAAIMLVTELRQMGRNVTLTQLASAPTPAGIAAGWIGGSRPRPAPDDRPTLFLVPGLGGEDPRLSTLCVAWGAIFNCVVLDYPDWACLAAPRFDLPALTDHFIYRIFDHTPNGPVLLAGYSLGGFVAWSIAKRLAGTPQPVQALFIFDSWIDEVVEAAKRSGTSDRVLRQVRAFTEAASGRDRAYLTQLLGEIIGRRLGSHPALLRLLAHVRRAHVPVHLRHWLHYSVSATRQLSIVNAQRIVEGLAGPPLDHTEVIVFEAAETSNLGGRATAMWRRLCTRLRTEQVSGNHLSMVKNRDFASLYQKLPRILFTLLSMPPPAGEDGMDDLGQGDPSDRPTAVQTAPMSRPATPLDHGGPEPWNLIVPQSQSCA